MAILAAGAMTTACSDWDDHYDSNGFTSDATATIWENIEANPNLSQFAELVKKAGYNDIINTSQTYTVWAPVNDTFNYDSLNALPLTDLRNHFAKHHIARFNHPATGNLHEFVTMLNEKMMMFQGNGSAYTLNGVTLTQPNLPAVNGTLHIIGDKLGYRENLYEALNTNTYPIDSMSNYFHSYDRHELDTRNSVQGPVVNGEITYLDSVFNDINNLYYLYNSYINAEDSNYTMIAPTNEAWTKAYNQVKKYYHYVPTFKYVRDVPMTNLNRATDDDNYSTVEINDTMLADSMIHRAIMWDLFYNNNLYNNGALNNLQTGQTLHVDSLVSTGQTILYSEDAAEVFKGATRVDKSNGAMWVTDSLRFHPWTSWNRIVKYQAEYGAANTYNSSTASYVRVTKAEQNPDVPGTVSGNGYLEITPAAAASNPEAIFYLPGVLSAEYAVYICFVPENITNTLVDNVRPNRVMVTMGYNDANGTPREERFRGYFENDPSKVDTVYIGDFTFPICYYGTGNNGTRSYSPYIRISSRATGNALTSKNDRYLRIDYIMLVPKDLDNYIKEHPDYKYMHDID